MDDFIFVNKENDEYTASYDYYRNAGSAFICRYPSKAEALEGAIKLQKSYFNLTEQYIEIRIEAI